MPIARNATISHVLMRLNVDMAGSYMVATFIKYLDSTAIGEVELRIDGVDMFSIISARGIPTQTLGDAITDAVYAHAINSGAISGDIVQPRAA